MNPHNGPGSLVNRGNVVLEMSFVRCAHFTQDGSAGLHHIRHAKGSSYFHKLAPGNNHFPALSQCVQDEHGGTGIVIGHSGRFCSGQFTEQAFKMDIPVPAAPGFNICGKNMTSSL
jgi:hypothetical protein